MSYKFKNSYKTISEVVEVLNASNSKKKANYPHTIRYWEKQFKQLKPKKINNIRYYNQKNMEILLKIQFLLKDQGMTINGVRKFLDYNILNIDENKKKIINSLNIRYRLNKINNLIKDLKRN